MTEKAPTQANAITPTFRQWFLTSRKHLAYPFATFLIFFTIYSVANIIGTIAGINLAFSLVVMAATAVMILATIVSFHRAYKLETRQTSRTVRARNSHARGSGGTTSGGDSSYAPMIIPGMHHYDDYPSHGGHSGKGHSDGGHSSHGGNDSGGYSGVSDSGGSSGGDGGGGGGE